MNNDWLEDLENSRKMFLPDVEKAEIEFGLKLYLEGTTQIMADLTYSRNPHPTPEQDEMETIMADMIALMAEDLDIE